MLNGHLHNAGDTSHHNNFNFLNITDILYLSAAVKRAGLLLQALTFTCLSAALPALPSAVKTRIVTEALQGSEVSSV